MSRKKRMTNPNSLNWYESHIEEPLRDITKHLRNNGINTQCSCAHEGPMYIECQFMLDGTVFDLHRLVFNYFAEKKLPVNFKIRVEHEVTNGHGHTVMILELPQKQNQSEHWDDMRKYHYRRARHYAGLIKEFGDKK